MKKIVFLSLFGLLFLLSCTDETLEVTVGDKYVDSQTTISMIDTISINMSTVKLDSLPTHACTYLMCGSYTSEYFGKTTTTAYTQLQIPSASISDEEVLDSIKIRLHYSGISYGDTTKPQTISVHEVLEDIELPDEWDVDKYLYNTQSYAYDPTPLGSKTVIPRPNRDDTLCIRLSDELGERFMDYLRDDDGEINGDNDNFVDLFKGIALVPGDENNSILSFTVADTSLEILVYTHEPDYYRTENTYSFSMPSASSTSVLHCQNIETDATGTGLESLTDQEYSVSSGSLENKAYVQAGTAYVTRLDIPNLDRLFTLDTKNILYKVELILKPVEGTFVQENLPELMLYTTGDRNKLESANIIYDEDDATVTSTCTVDEYYHENTYYYFNITDYIYNELSDGFIDPDDGILVVPTSTELYSTLNNVVLDARSQNKYRPLLKLYYVFYE